MPQIKQYDAPEGLGLRPTETGISAVAAAARRIGSEYSDIAASKAATGHAIGSAIHTAGDVATKYINHQQISQGAPAFAGLTQALGKEWEELQKITDPNDPTVAQRFLTERVEPQLEQFKSGFITEESQRWAESRADALRTHMFSKTSADMSNRAGQAAVINARQTVNKFSSAVGTDPSQANLDFVLKTFDDSTGALAGSTNLSAAAAGKIKGELSQRGREDIISSAVMGHIHKTGEVPAWASDPKYAPYIDAVQTTNAARTVQRAMRADDAYQRQQLDIAKREQSEMVMDDTIQKIYSDDPKVRASVSANSIAIDPRMSVPAKQNLIHLVERQAKPETSSLISNQTYVDLLREMRPGAERGDDKTLEQRIWDARLKEAGTPGSLNEPDFQRLRKELADSKTPEGAALMSAKRNFFDAVRPSIDKSNPAMGNNDPDGKMQSYRFELDLSRKIEEYRRAGKNPYDLFDPAKPDFMGRPETLQQYMIPMDQWLKNQASRFNSSTNLTGPDRTTTIGQPVEIKPGVPLNRKSGESAADYLKRIGKE